MSLPVLLFLLAAAPTPEEKVLASPQADGLALQLGGARRRLGVYDATPAWQYDFGAAWIRSWRPWPGEAHAFGLRATLSFPDFQGVEVAPLFEYRFGDVTTVNLAAGPMWRIDERLKGAGGYRAELAITPTLQPWSLYFGASHALFGLPELAVTFGVRFELLVYRPGRM